MQVGLDTRPFFIGSSVSFTVGNREPPPETEERLRLRMAGGAFGETGGVDSLSGERGLGLVGAVPAEELVDVTLTCRNIA